MRPLASPATVTICLICVPFFACNAVGGSSSNPRAQDDDGGDLSSGLDGDPSGDDGESDDGHLQINPGQNPGGGTTGDGDSPDADCDATIELIVRDFNSDHPDFQAFNGGQGEVGCGMVDSVLNVANGARTPTFFSGSGSGRRDVDNNGIISCTPWDEFYTGPSEITSADTFADWYNNVKGINQQIEYSLALSANAATGTYVFDSAQTAGFFPVDGAGFNEITENHNYHFTTEAHIRFGYQAGQKFTFSGDDDLWIFVNGKLALDLGGMHSPITATIDFDAQAGALGISPDNTYNMDIFHAERHTSASNFRVETNISCFEKVYVPVIR